MASTFNSVSSRSKASKLKSPIRTRINFGDLTGPNIKMMIFVRVLTPVFEASSIRLSVCASVCPAQTSRTSDKCNFWTEDGKNQQEQADFQNASAV